jgi:DNA polymerase-4
VTRWILHVDLDEFIAAVEILRRPELSGKPVVVGGSGDPTQRGVVATASYAARAFGIHSGMALRSAHRRCPDAVFLPTDMQAYVPYSERVVSTLRTFPALVRAVGMDEASMAIDTDDPEAVARDVQRAVLDATELWCSVGVGDNPLRAKIASGFAKPRGVFTLTRTNWDEVMGGLPPDALFGVGRRRMATLRAHGIRTVAELANADERELARLFGARVGPWLRTLATGEDTSELTAEPHVAKARGRERTFQHDLTDAETIRAEITDLARRVVDDLHQERRPAVRVVVKVRFAPFDTHTHGLALEQASMDPDTVVAGALRALERFELERPVRLLGVRAEMAPPGTGA